MWGRTNSRGVAAAIAVAMVASGCTSASSDSSEDAADPDAGPPPVEARPLSSATEAWWAYDRPADFESERTAVEVPVRDGTHLDCSLTRPASDGEPDAGPFPGLVVEFTPYQALRGSHDAEAAYFAERGYNAVVCNVRGTGDSGGTWQNAMSAQDGRDAYDLVEWLADQPFSDGRIGQVGESYGGQTSYGSAVRQAPHLRAIAPLQSPASLYDDVIYPGGMKTVEDGTIDNWPSLAQTLSGGRIDPAAEYATNREHPTFDDYWQERSFAGRYDDIDVPVLAMGGWEDGFFREGTLLNIEGAPDRTWAIYGPWDHVTPIRFPGCSFCHEDGLEPGVLLAWFDHWVMELPDVPVPDDPTFVSYEGPDEVGAGWRELSHWDAQGADPLTLVLGTDAELSEDDRDGVPGSVAFSQPGDPAEPDHVAEFATAPLSADRVLLGRPTLEIEATLTGPDANLYAELVDIGPDGRTTVVNDGFLRAGHRDSHVDPSPVEAGTPTPFTIEIRADHHRFAAGHSIGLRLSSGAADTLVPNDAPVDVAVTTGDGSSTLTLPGVDAL